MIYSMLEATAPTAATTTTTMTTTMTAITATMRMSRCISPISFSTCCKIYYIVRTK